MASHSFVTAGGFKSWFRYTPVRISRLPVLYRVVARAGVWQPGLTVDDKDLAEKIAESVKPRSSPSAVLQDALREYAEKRGVEA